MAKEVPQIVKFSLRSVLLSCQKGIKQTSIERDYYKLTNSNLDVKKYGYQDLYEFLLALPDVARLEFSVKDGENKVFGVAAEGVYMSDHAKKAEGIPNGLKPLPPSEWPRNKERKVEKSEERKKVLPNSRGLYGLHIKNLPPVCQESEISRIFKQFRSLREVKIENSSKIAFVRFSNYADAVRALSDMDGYSLRGAILEINPATERVARQNAKGGKDKKDESKMGRVNKNRNKTMTNGLVDKEAVVTDLKPGSSLNSSLPSPKERKTALSEESWEIDGGLSAKIAANETEKFFNQDNLVPCVYKVESFYPIHVSNFPAGTTQEALKQLFSTCGDIAQVKLKEKFAFIYFTKQEGAVTALQKMKVTKLGDKFLTVTPRTPKGKVKQQENSSVGSSTLDRTSSQSSVSSSDSLTPQSPISHTVATACSSGINSKGHTHTECNDGNVRVNGYSGIPESYGGQKMGSCSKVAETSNSMHAYEEGGKLEETKTASCSSKAVPEKGCSSLDSKPQTSVSVKQSVHVHTLLTYPEMCELLKSCKKPVMTLANIGAQEFDILVTDIVDSCHFWANIDDKIGSYKELEQIRNDLQIVEHHPRCMPIKNQLGASLFSEDKKWYRCWCLEVSKLERKEAKVFYVDYGNCEWISWDRFTDIHKRFWELAPQAVPFKLAGLENAAGVSPEILNEGSKYLTDLIINKVCRARTVQPSDPRKPHVIEVELIVNSEDKGEILVNKQMALTRYVQETRRSFLRAQAQLQPQQAAKQLPPRPSVNTPNAQLSQLTVQYAQSARQSVDQELLPSKQAQLSQQLTSSLKHPVQERPQNVRVNPQSLPNQNVETVEKSLPETLQKQQLPSYVYQLFEKKGVIEVMISYVVSPDEIYFFLADRNTQESLQRMTRMLTCEANPKAEIYPRVGNIVTRILKGPTGDKVSRVRIKSIPKGTTVGVVDTVVVQSVDYGWIGTVPLKSLCELPPGFSDLPPQAIRSKLAGIQKKPGLQTYPDIVKDMLIAVKKKREMLQASVVKRQKDGVLLVELFESEGPSLNVQLLNMDCVQLDESLKPLLCSNFVSAGLEGSGLSQNKKSSNLLVSTNQNPRLNPQKKRLNHYSVEVQSDHSDWEDSLLEVDWMEATPLTGDCKAVLDRQSQDHLYMPPPPKITDSSAVLPSSGLPSPVASASSVPSSSTRLSSMPVSLQPPSSILASSSSTLASNANVQPISSEGLGSSAPLDVRPPSSSGSESSDVHGSHTSLKNLSNAVKDLSVDSDTDNGTALSREQKILQDKQLAQSCLEKELVDQRDAQDWWQEKRELIQKDEELKRILDMPRAEMMKMISLRQEKEKLERKIRIKGLENQILKLQKELRQLELEKGELEGESSEK